MLLEQVRRDEHDVFKINLGFGSVLYDTVNQVYRYYYVSTNHYLFDRAFTISTNTDMTDFFNRILSLDLGEKYYFQRPSSGWVLVGLPNVEIRLIRILGMVIGAGIQLPDHIKKSRSIVSLTHDNRHGHDFNDNLCLFRCLALHFGGAMHNLEQPAKHLKEQLEKYTGKSFDKGVQVSMLTSVELCFKIAVNVYSLQEDKTAQVSRISNLDTNVMHLNLYENHFSYISKFKSYAKKYQCPNCSRILYKTCNLQRHVKKCQTEIKEVFQGGKYRNKKTVFELLDTIGIDTPKDNRFDPYFVVYDFEALQVPIDETLQGRTLHFKHVPATVSISSNVPGHTQPLHIRSHGNTQQLIDDFITELLKIQATRQQLMTDRHQPTINTLNERRVELIELGVAEAVEEEGEWEERGGESESEAEEVQAVGGKRKRKRSRRQISGGGGRKRAFLDNEAEVSGSDRDSDNDDSNDDDDDGESDVEGLIDDSSDVEGNNASFYQAFDRNRSDYSQPAAAVVTAGPSTAPQPTATPLTNEQEQVERKRLKKIKASFSKLMTYIEQITILGFNSQRYDIPLIRSYLPSAIIKQDGTPKQIIKKMNGYMALSSKRMKFLDITNYLAAGTSLKAFYKAYSVSTPKGVFPYAWFDSLEKLDATSLPDDIEEFHSILTKETITPDEFQACRDVWTTEGMTTFADFVRYYNNADVIGFVEAVDKMIAHERDNNKLDMFKDSVSLPGLTQKYLVMNLSPGEYFVGFGKEHSHLTKLLRENIVGGPSIIFHRYHEKDVTLIKGKYPCKKVIGYDANSLYLYCLGQLMPTGYYTLQEEKNNYKKETRYSQESIQWLEHVMRSEGVSIRHAENGGEVRVDNFSVDGYDESTRTVYEYYGCYWHGHYCNTTYNAERWSKTLERENSLRDTLGYNVVSITSCEWLKMTESKDWYSLPRQVDGDDLPPVTTTMENIIDDIMTDKLFGFVKIDYHVHPDDYEKFSEFPPIFKNCEITLDDIGEHMQAYCRSITRKVGVTRSLISSMHAEGQLILTPLLKKYIEMGLIVTRIELVIGYNGKQVFDWFVKEVSNDRRRADLGGVEFKMKGESSKLKGNCSYGYTVMDKSKHTKVSFSKEKNLSKHVNSPLLIKFDELNEQIFEVEKQQKKIVHDLPAQIGLAVYSYAKLRMLEFWEFINKFLVNDLYQLMEMDTDSLYIAFARDTIDDCVKPELREEWGEEKWKWFSSSDVESKTIFEGHDISVAQWDKRTPGKFKPEFEGDGMICHNSKVYIIWAEDSEGKLLSKTSCKGTQQKRNELLKEHFLGVLNTQKPHRVENAGFIKDSRGIIKTYTQKKVGMGYFYAKRKVLEDGVTTTHLDI